MAPLPFANTDIVFVDYQNNQAQHTMLIRVDENLTYLQIGDAISDFLIGVSQFFVASLITATRGQARGTNFSVPQDTGLAGTSFGDGAANQEQNATALTFVGRDLTGRRGRLSIFGYKGGLSDFRLTSAEQAGIGNAVGILNGRAGVFRSISGAQPLWYPYADVKASDYWVRRARS